MSRFKKLLQKKQTLESLSQHPLANAEEAVKNDYIQGLVFVAVEDENFSDEEKAYLQLIMQHTNMDTSKLADFESFALAPDESELMDFMDRLKAFDEGLKRNFLIEVILLAFKDSSFDEKEDKIFQDFCDIMALEEEASLIRHLATAIANQDIDLALALYTAQQSFVTPFAYLLTMADINAEEELKKLYQYQWVKWEFVFGGVVDDNLVATKPVNNRQIAVFLNALTLAGKVEPLPNSQRFEYKDDEGQLQPLIMDVEQSSLNHADGLFHYADDAAESDFVGAARTMPNRFTTWLNPWLATEVKWLSLYESLLRRSSSSSAVAAVMFSMSGNEPKWIAFNTPTRAYLTESEEMVLVKLPSNSNAYRALHKEEGCASYDQNQHLLNTTAYTFRLCQTNTTKEK
ncbi:MAG: hypothetical protein Q9N02_02385 [Ghiorsea sp.]|nr:hypothetical protein [Ghiorsea sp.]